MLFQTIMPGKPGVTFPKQKIRFAFEDFHEIFDESPVPVTTRTLILRRLNRSNQSVGEFPPSFLENTLQELEHNPNLIHVGDYWISQAAISQMAGHAIRLLKDWARPLRLDDIQSELTAHKLLKSQQITIIKDLVVEFLQHDEKIIALPGDWWLHENIIFLNLNRLHDFLLNTLTPQTSDQLIRQVLKIHRLQFPDIKPLEAVFIRHLQKDNRFLFDPETGAWSINLRQLAGNEFLFNFFTDKHRLFTIEELSRQLPAPYSSARIEADIQDDNRFRRFPAGQWGLSHWIWINDYAFNYLADRKSPASMDAILKSVCQKHEIHPDQAVFSPLTDARFIPLPGSLWDIRHLISSFQLDRLLAFLDRVGQDGLTAADLLRRALGLNLQHTDAIEKMSADDRFLCENGFWYSRAAAWHNLTTAEVDQIYAFLSSRPPDLLPVMIDLLTLDVLQRDYYLTDAVECLENDPRFIEVYPDWWVPDSFYSPLFDLTQEYRPKFFSRKDISSAARSDPESERMILRRRLRGLRQATARSVQDFKFTLDYLAIQYNLLRLPADLRRGLDENIDGVEFFDHDRNEHFIAFLNEDHTILHFGAWLKTRRLDCGDKIIISTTTQPGSLIIQVTGERDESAYQEGLRRRDTDARTDLPAEARKSFHDLMIEVMESYGEPLHREEIFRRVNAIRPANRNTISTLLSLPEIPYENYRYFVPCERSYWRFDRSRKEAYDMKILELENENRSLKLKLSSLDKAAHRQEQDRGSGDPALQALKNEKDQLARQVASLQQSLDQRQAELQAASQELAQIKASQSTGQASLTELNEQLARLFWQNQSLQQQQTELSARLSAVTSENQQLLVDHAETQRRLVEQENEFASLASLKASLVEQLSFAEDRLAESTQQVVDLKKEADDLPARLDEMEKQKKTAERKLSEMLRQFSAQQAELTDLPSRLAEYDPGNIISLKEQLDSQVRLCEIFGKDSARWSQMATSLKKQNSTLQKQMKGLKVAHARELADARRQIASLVEAKAAADQELAETRRQLEIFVDAKIKTDQRLPELYNELGMARDELDEMEKQKKAAEMKLSELGRQASAQQAELTDLRSRLAEMDRLTRDLAEAGRRADDLAARLISLETSLQPLKHALATPLGKTFIWLSRSKELADLAGDPQL